MSFWDELEEIRSATSQPILKELSRPQNQLDFLLKNIANADDSSELYNLGKSVDRFANVASFAGMSKDENPAVEKYNDKTESFRNSESGWSGAEGLYDEYMSSDTDTMLFNILQEPWKDTLKKKHDIMKIKDDIADGKAMGFKYRGIKGPTAIIDILNKTESLYDNKIHHMRENPKAFELHNTDGSINQAGMEFLDKYSMAFMTGDEATFHTIHEEWEQEVRTGFNYEQNRFNYFDQLIAENGGYKAIGKGPMITKDIAQEKFNQMKADGKLGDTAMVSQVIENQLNSLDMGGGEFIPWDWIEGQAGISRDNAHAYNEQYKWMTGGHLSDNPIWQFFDERDQVPIPKVLGEVPLEEQMASTATVDEITTETTTLDEPPILEEEKEEKLGEEITPIAEKQVIDDETSYAKPIGITIASGAAARVITKIPVVKEKLTKYGNEINKGVGHLKSSLKISNQQVMDFYNNSSVKNFVKNQNALHINLDKNQQLLQKTEKEISEYIAKHHPGAKRADVLNKIPKDLRNKHLKSTSKIQYLNRQITKKSAAFAKNWASLWGVDPQDVQRLFSYKNFNKWSNPFLLKDKIFSKIPQKLLHPKVPFTGGYTEVGGKKTFKPKLKLDITKIGKGGLQFRAGYATAKGIEEGIEKVTGLDVPEGPFLDTAKALAATHYGGKTVQYFWPKLTRMMTTTGGRKFLKDKLPATVFKALFKGFKGGKGSKVAWTVVGGYLTGKDIRMLIDSYREKSEEYKPIMSRNR